jgi:hypothetical protein
MFLDHREESFNSPWIILMRKQQDFPNDNKT